MVKDSSEAKETKDSQSTQDPNEILRQLVLQMSTIAQQIVNQPVLKDVSAAAAALASQGAEAAQAAQSAQVALMPAIDSNIRFGERDRAVVFGVCNSCPRRYSRQNRF